MSIGTQGFVMAADSPATWFLDTSMRVLASREHTNGAFTFIQWAAPVGFGPPRHIHPLEDEAFYLVEGGMDVVCGADRWAAGAGDFVFLPKGVPHAFLITEGPVHGLQVTSPAGFEDYVAELGRPATHAGLPGPTPPDHDRLMAVSERFGYQIIGPPLWAVDCSEEKRLVAIGLVSSTWPPNNQRVASHRPAQAAVAAYDLGPVP